MADTNLFNRNVSTDEEEDSVDHDTCTEIELAKEFQLKYKIVDEKAVSLQKEYILGIAADSAFTRVAVGLENTGVKIYDIDQSCGLSCVKTGFPPSEDLLLCGIQFFEKNSNSLLVGTTDGIIRQFDLRTSQEEAQFKNSETNLPCPKGITCFDTNANGRVICTGTDKFGDDVYLNFFDVRMRNLMGSYVESHADDITCVRFHPQNSDLLCTGATDGLINKFDIKEPDEYDALMSTINTESSVHKLDWHLSSFNKDRISCITHTNDFKAYEEDDLIGEFSRTQITEAAKRKNEADCNLVSAHSLQNGDIFLVVGNFSHREKLRTVSWQKKSLKPLADFENNKQLIRDSLFEPKNNVLITAGESGIVSVWNACTPDANKLSNDSDKFKSKSKKLSRREPY